MNKIKLLMPIVGVTTLFNVSAIATSCSFNGPKHRDFLTDSWQKVAFYANQGLSKLCKTYGYQPKDFLGKTREIEINGYLHKVMVIGTNQDQYKKDGKDHNAALTFRFNNFPSRERAGAGQSLYVRWQSMTDPQGNKNYWDGALEQALNSTNDVTWDSHTDEHRSLITMVKDSDPKSLWTNSIKSVSRSVCVYKENQWTAEEKNVQFFLPTISNIFSKSGIEDSTDSYFENYDELLLSEGQSNLTNKQYAYYALPSNIGNETASVSKGYDCLICRSITGDAPTKYWLATPSFNDSNFLRAFHITNTGSIWTASAQEVTWYFAPCFCI